jgi:hypothetical protein
MNPAATALEPRLHAVDSGLAASADQLLLRLNDPARSALLRVDVDGLSLEAAGEQLGLDTSEVRELLAEARTALRRGREAISGGGRCLRARRLLSASMDKPLDPFEARVLQAHLDNCLRCPRHEELLAEELDALRDALREPPVRAPVQLRSVPAPAEVPEGTRSEPARASEPAATVARRPAQATQRRLRRRVAVALAAIVLAVGVIDGAGIAIDKLDSSPPPSREAPWAKPSAPDIPPKPIE